MICRRCGMDSSTTDTCEWCRKPMLPPGGAISAKAKEEIVREKNGAAPAAPEVSPATRADESELEAVIRRPEAAPPPTPTTNIPGLTALGAHITEQDTQPQAAVLSTVEQTTNEEILRPLGSAGTLPGGQEVKDNNIYIGNEEDVVRPIERPSKDGSKWVVDASGRKRRVADDTPEVPDKVRLLRGTLHGALVALVMAILQFIIKKQVPDHAVVIYIEDAKTFVGALKFGLYSAVLFGFMLSALLTQRKWGPAAGFFIGIPMGWAVVSMAEVNNMPFPLITGVLCGIFVGRQAVKGVKRVVSV